MNFFKKNLIADIEATKQNKALVAVSVAMGLPSLLSPFYELYLREKIKDQEEAERFGRILENSAVLMSLFGMIPTTIYQIRRRKIYKSL